MQKEMKWLLAVLVILVVACVAAAPFLFPWLSLASDAWLAKPNLVQKTGEFPYKLVYRINGEEISLEDTIVIEFEDFEYNPEVGEPNYSWNMYLKRNAEAFDGEIPIHQGEDYTIHFSFCSPEHYMGVGFDAEEEAFWLNDEKESRTIGTERLEILYGIEVLEMILPEPLKK